ncbi:MAG: hypothetical protein AAFW64_09290, partial [Pseudomonadota bacterium]
MSDLSPLFSVKDRVAVVTGASSGLGQRAATALADAGARVAGAPNGAAMARVKASNPSRSATSPATLARWASSPAQSAKASAGRDGAGRCGCQSGGRGAARG